MNGVFKASPKLPHQAMRIKHVSGNLWELVG